MILITQRGDKAVNMDFVRELFVYTEGREKKRHVVVARHNYNGWDGQFALGEYSTLERAQNVFERLVGSWANARTNFQIMPKDEEEAHEDQA